VGIHFFTQPIGGVHYLKINNNVANFKLPDKYGGLQLSLPVVDWKTIRSAESREKRPVVEMELCVGPKRLRVHVNLNDRSMVKYPLILGRNVLKDSFVVDCIHSHILSMGIGRNTKLLERQCSHK
jgi:hypothetical protein